MAFYIEPQHLSFCGKHAINNMLQMEKLIANKKEKRLLVPGPGATNPADPLDPRVQINMTQYCRRRFQLEQKQGYGADALECDDDGGDYTFDVLASLLQNVLRFRADTQMTVKKPTKTNPGAVTDPKALGAFLKEHLAKPDLVGIILNYDNGYHWTTVLPKSTHCPQGKKSKKLVYTLIDSIGASATCYKTLPSLVKALKDENTTLGIAVSRGQPEPLQRLVNMGIDEELARRAIAEHGSDEESAFEAALSGKVSTAVRPALAAMGFSAAAVEPVLVRRGNDPRRFGVIAKDMVATLPPVHTVAEAKAQLMGLGFSEDRVDRAVAKYGTNVRAAFGFLRRGAPATTRKIVRAPCGPGQVRNRSTKACRDKKKAGKAARSPCPPGQVRNRTSKACRDKKKAGRPSKKAASP